MSSEKVQISKRNKDVILGVTTIVFAVIYSILAFMLPDTPGIVDSRFLPLLLSGCLMIVGIIQMGVGIKKPQSAETSKEIDKSTLLKTIAITIIYILLYKSVGFVVMTFVYLVIQMSILTPPYAKKNYLLYIIIAICTSLGVYYLFYHAFNIFLPRGILYGIL